MCAWCVCVCLVHVPLMKRQERGRRQTFRVLEGARGTEADALIVHHHAYYCAVVRQSLRTGWGPTHQPSGRGVEGNDGAVDASQVHLIIPVEAILAESYTSDGQEGPTSH